MKLPLNYRPLVLAGTVLGMGLGGFVDGILLHQILQLHNMLSNTQFPDTLVKAEINMFWDGLFHVFAWSTTVFGLLLLWKAIGAKSFPYSGRTFVGSMLFGWGIFNLIEGIVDHHLFQIHHVVQRAPMPDQLYWDLLFLTLGGGLFMILGRWNILQGASKK